LQRTPLSHEFVEAALACDKKHEGFAIFFAANFFATLTEHRALAGQKSASIS
jgi:hypothetical protein